MKLPRELWGIILRIKTKLFIRERMEKIRKRLEKTLEFPVRVPVLENSYGAQTGIPFYYRFTTASHEWILLWNHYILHISRYHNVNTIWNRDWGAFEEEHTDYFPCMNGYVFNRVRRFI